MIAKRYNHLLKKNPNLIITLTKIRETGSRDHLQSLLLLLLQGLLRHPLILEEEEEILVTATVMLNEKAMVEVETEIIGAEVEVFHHLQIVADLRHVAKTTITAIKSVMTTEMMILLLLLLLMMGVVVAVAK